MNSFDRVADNGSASEEQEMDIIEIKTPQNAGPKSKSKRYSIVFLLTIISVGIIGIVIGVVAWHYLQNDATTQPNLSNEQAAAEIIINGTRYLWYTEEINDGEFALGGIDVVEYFNLIDPADVAVVGDTVNFVSTFEGIQWAFIDEINKDLFDASPDKYVPRFGGYCALGLASGNIVDTDPNAWTVYPDIDGRLYLNVNVNAREKWLDDVDALITNAETNWNALGWMNPPQTLV